MASLYLDHNVAADVAFLLRASNHAVTTAYDAGMAGAHDDEQMLFAARRGSTLVTHNRSDFVLLHGACRRWSAAWGVTQTHAGILVVPQPPIATSAQIAHALDTFLAGRPSLANELYRWRPTSGWQQRE